MVKEKNIILRWKELPVLFKIKLISGLVAGICGAACYAITTKLIYSNVEVDTLTSRILISSLIGITLSALYLNFQNILFKKFIQFVTVECLIYTGLILYVIFTKDFAQYLIWSAIIGGTISHITNNGSSKVHQMITDVEQYRTDYTFFNEIVSSLGVVIGSVIAFTLNITMAAGFILLLVSLIGMDLIDIYIYTKIQHNQQLTNG